MPNDSIYQEQFFAFTLMDVKSCVEQYGDLFFSELETMYPDIYDKLEAYMANKQVQEFLSNQEEVL